MRGYLAVAVLGFAIGLLCAPTKGSVLRKEIKDCFNDLQQSGAERFEEAQRMGRAILDKVSPAISQA